MTLRVLHVYSGNLFGGIETLLLTFARHTGAIPGLEQRFALCFEGRLSAELVAAGAPPVVLGSVSMRQPWTVLRARRRLRQLLSREPCSVVVCHTSWVHAVFGPVARSWGLPLVHYIHNPVTSLSLHDRWAQRTPPDLVIAVSQDTRASVSKLFPHCPVEHLYGPMPRPLSGYANPDRGRLRADLGCPPAGVVILQASRLDPWKGHEHHLRALGEIKDLTSWVCWIAGGAQRPKERRYLQDLRALAAALGLEGRVRFLGHRDDVPQLLASADILCQANTGPEGLGLAFVEAACAGLPIVTTDIGAAPEIVEPGCTGFLVPVGDVPAIASALRHLIADGELRRRLGEAGRRRVIALCQPEAQLKRFAELLSRCAGSV